MDMGEKRFLYFLLLLALLFSLLIRIANIDATPAFDEFVQYRATLFNDLGLEKTTGIPPLSNWIRLLFISLFGFSVISIRLASIVFSYGSVLLLYLIAKERHGEKTAIISAIIMLFSAWFAVTSFSISFNGPFLVFFMLLMFYFYDLFIQTDKVIYLVLTGFAFGMGMLVKYDMIFMYAIILFGLFSNINKLKALKSLFVIGFSGILVFSIFPLLSYFTDFSNFTITLFHGFNNRPTFNFMLLVIQFVYAFIWMGPIIIAGFFLYDKKQKNKIYWVWIILYVIFYTFIIKDNFRPIERYFYALLPPLVILISQYASKIKFSRYYINFVSSVFAGGIVFALLNLLPDKYITFYPKTNFMYALKSFNLFFEFPFTGDQGPIGFYFNFFSIVLWFFVSFIFLLVIFLKHKKSAFVIVFGLFIAFSVVIQIEMSFHVFHDNVEAATKDLSEIINKNYLDTDWIIYRQAGIATYFSNYSFMKNSTSSYTYLIKTFEKMDYTNKTIFFVDFPRIRGYAPIDYVFSRCVIEYETPKDNPIGYILKC